MGTLGRDYLALKFYLQKQYKQLGRWLHGLENALLLQRTWVVFSAPVGMRSQLSPCNSRPRESEASNFTGYSYAHHKKKSKSKQKNFIRKYTSFFWKPRFIYLFIFIFEFHPIICWADLICLTVSTTSIIDAGRQHSSCNTSRLSHFKLIMYNSDTV